MVPKDMSDLCFYSHHISWSLTITSCFVSLHGVSLAVSSLHPVMLYPRLTTSTVPQVTSHCLRGTHHPMAWFQWLTHPGKFTEITHCLSKVTVIRGTMPSPSTLLMKELSVSYHCWYCGCLHGLAGGLPGCIPHPKSCLNRGRWASWEWLGSETGGHHRPRSPSCRRRSR